jgi:hypothetical protein
VFARVTQLEIDTLRIDVATAIAQYEKDILPLLKQQPGYAGILMLSNDQGAGVVISLWETEEAADIRDTGGFYSEVLEHFTTIFRAPPGRERYEVSMVDVPPGSPFTAMLDSPTSASPASAAPGGPPA